MKSAVLIRAMANTICDNNVDPHRLMEVTMTLIRAGFSVKDISNCLDEATAMAAVRQANSTRKGIE